MDPLILIDGIESTKTDLSRLQPDDIAAFSILKDATATALYGARGANGVIQVSTKTGEVGAARISLRFENSFSMNNKDIELADPITFMKLANEAARTRNPLAPLEYSQEKIDRTARGDDPYLYPANDWYSMLMKKVTTNQRLNMNISGGGNVARYYIAGTLNMDNGNLKVDKRNNFNSNINLKTYQVRSNININLSKSTEGIVRMSGTFDDYRGPLKSGQETYEMIMKSNPVLFPAYYPSSLMPTTKHILFGNAMRGSGGGAAYTNPYAELVKGYKDYGRSTLDIQLELKQDFDFLVKGLKARVLFNTSRYSYFEVSRNYNPYYYNVSSYDKTTGDYTLMLLNGNEQPHRIPQLQRRRERHQLPDLHRSRHGIQPHLRQTLPERPAGLPEQQSGQGQPRRPAKIAAVSQSGTFGPLHLRIRRPLPRRVQLRIQRFGALPPQGTLRLLPGHGSGMDSLQRTLLGTPERDRRHIQDQSDLRRGGQRRHRQRRRPLLLPFERRHEQRRQGLLVRRRDGIRVQRRRHQALRQQRHHMGTRLQTECGFRDESLELHPDRGRLLPREAHEHPHGARLDPVEHGSERRRARQCGQGPEPRRRRLRWTSTRPSPQDGGCRDA